MHESTSAFFWGDGISIFNSGSVFFINTSRKLLAVTARHVYEGYLRASLDRRLLCQLDSLSFDPTQRLVSKGNGAADIATFEVAGHELVGLGKTTLPWPPVKPEIGHAMLVCGVPAVGRSVPFLGKAQFTWYSGMFAVENISDTSMSFIKPPNERLVDITGRGFPPAQLDVGGMSGGPVAAIQQTETGLITWSLAGAICEGHQKFEIIRAVRADLINDDGTIKDQ